MKTEMDTNDTPKKTAPATADVTPAEAKAPNGAAPPVDELLLGEFNPQELQAIQQVKTNINQNLMEIGHLEVRKAMTLANLDQLEAQGQKVIADARTRLGIDPGVVLQVSPDGKVRRAPSEADNVVPLRQPQAPPKA